MRLLLITVAILCNQLIAQDIKSVSPNIIGGPDFYSKGDRPQMSLDDLYVYNSIQQISEAFNLPKNEFFLIKPKYSNFYPEMNKFKEMIKKGFGVDIVWVEFGNAGVPTTNKGRKIEATYLGYRVDSTRGGKFKKSKAVLISVNQSKQDLFKTIAHELVHVMQDEEPEFYTLLQGVNKTVDSEFKSYIYSELRRLSKESNMKVDSKGLEDELTAYIVQSSVSDPLSFWAPILENIEGIPEGTIERKKLGSVEEAITKIFVAWVDSYRRKEK